MVSISPGKSDLFLYIMFVVIQLPRSVNGIKRCFIYHKLNKRVGYEVQKEQKYTLRIPTVEPESCLIKSKIWKFRGR